MKTSKKLKIFFLSLFCFYFLNVVIDLACAGEEDPYDYTISFFHNTVQGNPDYKTFYFTDQAFLYSTTEHPNESDINSKEWAAYLGRSVRSADVRKAMYQLDSASGLKVIVALGNSAALPDSLAGNTFLQILKSPEHQAALQYYLFSKKMEPLANTGSLNSYSWNPAPVDTTALHDGGLQAVKAGDQEKDSFLKLRYYYQAQKFFHYSADYGQALKVYTSSIENAKTDSHVKGWALALKAGEERKQGDTLKAAYHFSQVFTYYPERRIQAYRNYLYMNNRREDVANLATQDNEKASVYAISGFSNPELDFEDLQNVYKYAPSSPMVGVLLVREINKLEEHFVSQKLGNPGENTSNLSDTTADEKREMGTASPFSRPKIYLYAGIGLFLIGMLLLFFVSSGKNRSRPGMVTGVVLLTAGIGFIIWNYSRKKTVTSTSTPATGFFVKLPDSVEAKYADHIKLLHNFCDQLISDSKYGEPQIANLASAYMYWMENKNQQGTNELAKLENYKLNTAFEDQKQIISLLLSAQAITAFDSINEQKLLPALQWLDLKVTETDKVNLLKKTIPESNFSDIDYEKLNRFAATSRNFYRNILAGGYLREKDSSRAALAMLKAESESPYTRSSSPASNMGLPAFWLDKLSSAQVNQILAWKKSSTLDPFMKFYRGILSQVGDSSLYELLGTCFLREHSYKEAYAAFQHVPSPASPVLATDDAGSADPFHDQINDYPKDFTSDKQGYDKKRFALEMGEYMDQIKKDPKNAAALYKIASGLYNTSTYGNSYNLISYEWSSGDFGRENQNSFDDDYIKTLNAEKYYLMARDASSDPEFKARCTFMAAKCTQKQAIAPSFASYDTYEAREKKYKQALRSNAYFGELLSKYNTSQFYKDAIEECSYLKDYNLKK